MGDISKQQYEYKSNRQSFISIFKYRKQIGVIMNYKINDKVQFKANSLDDGRIVGLPDEDTHMYSIELRTGNIIKCTEHYIQKSINVS